ncbi:MAG TPA: hypothetical protein VGJ37_08860 [Pyrinomonadaceae bacterium]|jgi:hypothetical protein
MTDKEIVQDLLRGMPDDVSLYDIARKVEFIAAVRQGLLELDESKDSISIEQVERKPSWSVTVGRRRRGRQKRKQVTH